MHTEIYHPSFPKESYVTLFISLLKQTHFSYNQKLQVLLYLKVTPTLKCPQIIYPFFLRHTEDGTLFWYIRLVIIRVLHSEQFTHRGATEWLLMPPAFVAQLFSNWEEASCHLRLCHQSQYLRAIKTRNLYRLNPHVNVSGNSSQRNTYKYIYDCAQCLFSALRFSDTGHCYPAKL